MNSLLPSASAFSQVVNGQVLFLVIVSTFLTVLVFAMMVFFCIKYRKNSVANRENAPTQSRTLEMSLIAVILSFGMVTFVVSAKTFFQMYTPPANAKEIFVVAKQWLWIFNDPNHPHTDPSHLNELTVTLNEPIRLTMISEDVIHSFYVPAFRMKQDVLPDRYTTVWFTPTELGDFEVLCTQYCGLRHSEMRAVIHVVPNQNRFASATPLASSSTESREKILREKGCLSCHESNGTGAPIGPTLTGIFGTKVELADGRTAIIDENYLRRSLFEPNADVVKGYAAIMPSFLGLLSESETNEILRAIQNKKSEKSE